MTNVNRWMDRAARQAGALPLARIVALMLGGSAAFFCLAMPPRVLDTLFASVGLPAAGRVGHWAFALFCTLLAAALGWLAITATAGAAAAPAPVRAPSPAARRRPVRPAEGPLTLRRSDSHPDAPPRRPIFAAQDLGTPFDEIVTDRSRARPAPEPAQVEEKLVFEDPMVEAFTPPAPAAPAPAAPDPVTPPPATAAPEAVAEPEPEPAPVEVAQAPVEEPVAPPQEAAAPVVEAVVDPVESDEDEAEAEAAPEEPEEPEAPEAVAVPAVRDATPPQREDSLAALMARFEGGLDRLGGAKLPPPDPSAISPLKRARSPDDALRDALEALQRMAARQR